MAGDIEFDFSELGTLAADLGRLADGAQGHLLKAVQVTAHGVKDSWNGKLFSDGHARRTRGSVSYDVEVSGSEIVGEIGPKVGRPQAKIVRLLENGSINNPARGFGAAALHENEADFERGVDKAIADALKAAGL